MRMAKKASKRRASSRSEAPPAVMQVERINPFGDTQPRKVIKSVVRESEFTLNDGTKLILKPLIGDVRRAVGQYNAAGQPVYFLTIGNALQSKPPKTLMQKIPKKKASE
jgi:hypothetical protein